MASTEGRVNDPSQFRSRSRLHFIGSWVQQQAAPWLRDVLFQEHPEWNHTALFGRPRVVCHCDMDAFFCAVALSKPEHAALRSAPVAISSGASAYCEIASCNYLARAAGVRAGMWMRDARALCPELCVLGYDFARCRSINLQLYRAAFELCPDGTHILLQVLSVDEVLIAFDGIGAAEAAAYCAALRERMETDTACTLSCGIACNVAAARLATAGAKPNGVKVVADADVAAFMRDAPASSIHGIGPEKMTALRAALQAPDGEPTLGECLDRIPSRDLQKALGSVLLARMRALAAGDDGTLVVPTGLAGAAPKAIASTMNYAVRVSGLDAFSAIVVGLARDVAAKLHTAGKACTALRLVLRTRAPDAKFKTLKHLGCGYTAERVGAAVRAAEGAQWTEAAKIHDVIFAAAARSVAPWPDFNGDFDVEPVGLPAPVVDPRAPVWLHDLRGLSLIATGLVDVAAAAPAGPRMQQISLTAFWHRGGQGGAGPRDAAAAASIHDDGSDAPLLVDDDDATDLVCLGGGSEPLFGPGAVGDDATDDTSRRAPPIPGPLVVGSSDALKRVLPICIDDPAGAVVGPPGRRRQRDRAVVSLVTQLPPAPPRWVFNEFFTTERQVAEVCLGESISPLLPPGVAPPVASTFCREALWAIVAGRRRR